MHTYYTSVAFSTCAALGVLSVLVMENDRLDRQSKRRFYNTYLVIAAAILAEWGAVALNGAASVTIPLHKILKALDYITSPMASVMLVHQIQTSRKTRIYAYAVLAANAVLEILSIFTGWTFYVDADNYYHHGPLFAVYSAVFCLAFFYALIAFWKYGKKFRKNNRLSLIMIFLFTAIELALQEIIGGEVRTLCIGLTFSSVFLYVHFSEFAQLERDDVMSIQQKLLDTDPLTGLYSRFAYTRDLEKMERSGIPGDTVIIAMDVNGLKQANDTLGHLAGDELIIGAANCVRNVLGLYGRCYRTGGDEFVAMLRLPKETAAGLKARLNIAAESWKGQMVKELHFAVGLADRRDNPDCSADELVGLADKEMYRDKSEYYRSRGIDRRRH